MPEEKSRVLPVYKELKGLLAQAPEDKGQNTYDSDLWEKSNLLIDELKDSTQSEIYEKYRLKPLPSKSSGKGYLSVATYRGLLNALIMRLQGVYEFENQDPFSGSPSTVMNQYQNTNVQILVQLGMDLQQAMDKAENENEKSFISKIKERIGEIKSFVEFVNLVATLAIQSGITLERLKMLFAQ